MAALLLVARHVDDDRRGQDQDVVLPLPDLDAVGVGQREPPLRDLGHDPATPMERVLVVAQVAHRLQVVRSRPDSSLMVKSSPQEKRFCRITYRIAPPAIPEAADRPPASS